MNDNITFARASEIDQTRSGDRLVLYHADGRKALVLNPTGSLVWKFLQKPKTLVQLLTEMQSEFPDVEADLLKSDLQAYLQSMSDQEVITQFG